MSAARAASPCGGWVFALRALDKLGGEATTEAIHVELRTLDRIQALKALKYGAVRFGVVVNAERAKGWRSPWTIPDGTRWAITERGRAFLDGRLRLVRPPSGPKGGTTAYVFEEVRP